LHSIYIVCFYVLFSRLLLSLSLLSFNRYQVATGAWSLLVLGQQRQYRMLCLWWGRVGICTTLPNNISCPSPCCYSVIHSLQLLLGFACHH
jgi:hypothetical protein